MGSAWVQLVVFTARVCCGEPHRGASAFLVCRGGGAVARCLSLVLGLVGQSEHPSRDGPPILHRIEASPTFLGVGVCWVFSPVSVGCATCVSARFMVGARLDQDKPIGRLCHSLFPELIGLYEVMGSWATCCIGLVGTRCPE